MSLVSVVARAQRAAERLMVDTCTITRPGDTDGTFDTPVVVYSGKCRVRDRTDLPGETTDRHRFRVDIPISATGVRFNDRIDISASMNPSLVGSFGLVGDIFAQSAASAQRLPCELTLR